MRVKEEVQVSLRPVRQLRSSGLFDNPGMLAYNIGVAKSDCSTRPSSAFGVLVGNLAVYDRRNPSVHLQVRQEVGGQCGGFATNPMPQMWWLQSAG